MAERNPQIPHYIQSLLYVNRDGNYCGYRPELTTDNISEDLKEFLICSECKGIIRRARQWGGKTVCEMCVTGRGRDIDERVENKVESLNSNCPMSGNGCGWKGKLGKIEQHMQVCSKILVECKLKCGIEFEREATEHHNKEVCPLRMIECQYCKGVIQAREANQHIVECTNHPDTKQPCPYKELGCNAIVLRKDKDKHLTGNMIGHQKLMLDQLNKLKNKNKQLEQLNEQQKNKDQEQERVNNQQKRKNEQQKGVNNEQKRKNEQLENKDQEQERVNNQQERINNQQKGFNNQQESVNNQQERVNNEQKRKNEQQKNKDQEQERVNNQQERINNQQKGVNNQQKGVNNQQERVNNQQERVNNQQERVNEIQNIKDQKQQIVNMEQKNINEQHKDRMQTIEKSVQDIKNQEWAMMLWVILAIFATGIAFGLAFRI